MTDRRRDEAEAAFAVRPTDALEGFFFLENESFFFWSPLKELSTPKSPLCPHRLWHRFWVFFSQWCDSPPRFAPAVVHGADCLTKHLGMIWILSGSEKSLLVSRRENEKNIRVDDQLYALRSITATFVVTSGEKQAKHRAAGKSTLSQDPSWRRTPLEVICLSVQMLNTELLFCFRQTTSLCHKIHKETILCRIINFLNV